MYNFTLQLLKEDAKRTSDEVRHSRILESWEYAKLGNTMQLECDGDIICKNMNTAWEYLDTHGYDRSPQQRVMLKAWLAISYGQLYGDQIQQHLVRLLSETGWSELRSEMAVLMARRGGKSVMVSLGGAAEAVVIPWPHDVLIYSNNGRASKMLMLMMFKFTKMLSSHGAPFGGKVVALNKSEEMKFQTQFDNINEIFAYPAKPENLRGTGSKNRTGTVVAEEFAYMPLEVFYEIIGPTLTRDNVKFVGITTTSGSDSFVTPLMEAKFADGRAVILTLNFELVCEDCKKAGIPEKCKCLMADIPHWQSAGQHEKLEVIMKNHLETFLREIRGMQIDKSVAPAFNPKAVQRLTLQSATLISSDIDCDTIFMAVDPACGGDHSKFAIVSAVFLRHVMVVSHISPFYCSFSVLCVLERTSSIASLFCVSASHSSRLRFASGNGRAVRPVCKNVSSRSRYCRASISRLAKSRVASAN